MLRKLTTFAITGLLSTLMFTPRSDAAGPGMTPRDIYAKTGKAVVLVFATDGSAQGSAGTGSIITDDGQIITNAHVVSKDGRPYAKIFVYLKPDKIVGSMKDDLKARYDVQIVDIDPNLDLALLKMKAPPTGLTVMPFANPDDVNVGDPVVAIGHPETGGLWTLTTGVVSTVVKDFQGVEGKDVFQTEASINRGNSGGPLINEWGNMVGINTCISRRAADGLAITSINFSLKSSVPVMWMKKKDLVALNYAKPGLGDGQTQVAAADPKAAEKPAKETYTIKGEKGEKVVAVVEPNKGQDVADDPGFNQAAGAGAQGDTKVSSGRTIPTEKAKPGTKPTKLAGEPPPAKILTKPRPYKLEPFVSDRIREIKALEDIMDESEKTIQERTGKGKKRPSTEGNGLW